MKKLLLLFMVTFGSIAANADTWALIGKGYYEDPFWTRSSKPLSGEVDVEESYETPGLYRFKQLLTTPTLPYLYVHCENCDKVYVEPYTALNSNSDYATVIQLCEENGWHSSINSNGEMQYLYGSFENNIVHIPGNYFISYLNEDEDGRWRLDSDRNFILKLPSEGDATMPSGIYFGITAFNYLPNFTQIKRIDSSNKNEYLEFVNSQELDDYTYLYYYLLDELN